METKRNKLDWVVKDINKKTISGLFYDRKLIKKAIDELENRLLCDDTKMLVLDQEKDWLDIYYITLKMYDKKIIKCYESSKKLTCKEKDREVYDLVKKENRD